MPITANVTNEQITANVGETKIDVSVGGGVGPTGPAGAAGASSWADITGKPSTFAPSAHAASHAVGGADALTPADIGAAAASHASTHAAGGSDELELEGGQVRIQAGVNASSLGADTNAATFLHTLNANGIGPALAAVSYSLPAHTHAASAINSGTLDIARIPTGTTSTTVSLGNHTHSQLHDRSHAITSSSDHTATAWRLFYSNGSGVITELTLGSSGTVLTSAGASAAPTFSALPSGGSTNVWIPASAFIPRTTNGCGVDSRETSTNRTNWDELLFDAGADEFAQAAIVLPSNYNAGTFTARFYWTASGATDGSDDVIWGIQARAFANDDALDTAFGTAQTVADTVIATNDMHVSSATSAVTAGGTPAANVPLLIQIYRDADAAGDTYGHDARLLGVEIIYTAA